MLAYSATSQPTQAFRDSLNLLLDYSHDGYKNFRYNEKETNGVYNYKTTLSFPGFTRSNVQIASTKLYGQKQPVIKAGFFAVREFSANEPALQFMQKLVADIIQSIQVSGIDSTPLAGFKKHYIFLVKKNNQPAITIETGLLNEPGFFLYAKITSEHATDTKGIMDTPPSTVSTGSYSYSDIKSFLKAMLGFSKDNFSRITGKIMPGAKWDPTYECKVSFRDFVMPRIEYVTNILWNQYVTATSYPDEAEARKLFKELSAEIDNNIQAFSMQKYPTGDENWNLWYIHHGQLDNKGGLYHNNIKLEIKKTGTMYMVELHFIKMSGQ